MSNSSLRLLLVEDDVSLAAIYKEYLSAEGFDTDHVERGDEALSAIEANHYHVLLLDLNLPDVKGFDILGHVKQLKLDCSIIVITADGSVNKAVEAMRLGAYDFILKPFNKERLTTTVRNAVAHTELKETVETIRDELGRDKFYGFIGRSLAMQGVYSVIENVAKSKATVFITGESGTGKEVCAEAIHKASPRSNKPFVPLNCGAIPKDLIESEIFGHIKGSFTGAVEDRSGAAKSADGGTLFLDEICEMDLAAQTKLLRFIQSQQIQSVGSSKQIPVDVRIICATNKNPIDEVREGRFREDLFYRLHVVPIQLPALRERDDDALELGRYFLQRFSTEEGKSFKDFDEDMCDFFASYDWPGNVRELQNLVRNMVVLNEGDLIEFGMLPPSTIRPVQDVYPETPKTESLAASSDADSIRLDNHPLLQQFSGMKMWQIEKAVIEAVIESSDGSIPKAARVLGLSPSTIYRKLELWNSQT